MALPTDRIVRAVMATIFGLIPVWVSIPKFTSRVTFPRDDSHKHDPNQADAVSSSLQSMAKPKRAVGHRRDLRSEQFSLYWASPIAAMFYLSPICYLWINISSSSLFLS